jgi:phosphohistidine phosphatase
LIFANAYGYPKNSIQLKEEIYEASASRLIYVLASLPTENKTVFLFGHNPGLTDLINELCNSNLLNLPTSGVAIIDFNIQDWNEVSAGSGQLYRLYEK